MMKPGKSNALKVFVFVLGISACATSHAWYGGGVSVGFGGGGNVHYHGDYRNGYGPRGYGYYYGGGPEIIVPSFVVPNVVINVPVQRYYVRPPCDDVEVCNQYGECWLEQYCG